MLKWMVTNDATANAARPARWTGLRRVTCRIGALALLCLLPAAQASLIVGTDTLEGVSYTTYQEPGQTSFRIVCQSPCPIPLATLQAASDGFAAAREDLLVLSGVDVTPELRPVDIAYEENSICSGYTPGITGYSTYYMPYGPDGNDTIFHGKACLFLWNKQQDGLIDYFTPTEAQLRTSQILAIHEYAHTLLFFRHRYSYEALPQYWTYRVRDDIPPLTGLCDSRLDWVATQLLYDLCQAVGANEADLRWAMQRLDWLYQNDLGFQLPFGSRAMTSVRQFREAFDERLGVDTSAPFLSSGMFAPQEVGRTFTGQRLTDTVYQFNDGFADGSFWLSAVSLDDVTGQLLLEQPTCLATDHPFVDFTTTFMLIKPMPHDGVPQPSVVSFAEGSTITYSYAHQRNPIYPPTGPIDVNPLNFKVYYLENWCGYGTATPLEQLPDSDVVFDHVAKKVTFRVRKTGVFGIYQADEIFRGAFE